MFKNSLPFIVLIVVFLVAGGGAVHAQDLRAIDGLQLLYEFGEGKGADIPDLSGAGEALDLKVAAAGTVRWGDANLEVLQAPVIHSQESTARLAKAIRKSQEITLEAWLTPANLKQKGPARIFTLSKSSSIRNFTLGQEGDRYVVRLRTSKTGNNGINPPLESKPKAAAVKLTHVVYTRNSSGKARLYVDGKLNAEADIPGDLAAWANDLTLALGDEVGGGRPWLGGVHLLAVYDRDLSSGEVERHFRAGAKASAAPGDEARLKADALTANRHLFEKKIAPLFAEHCLECHDTGTREGKLDLSRKSAGHQADGIIIAGKSADSLLWESIESDEMPEDRDPLSAADKKLLREWIDGGAQWSIELIDPAVYAHASGHEKRTQWVRRLTIDEYVETVRATVGVDIEKQARELLPADLRADGFSNTAYNLNIDLKHVDAYAQLAETIVGQMDVAAFAGKYEKSRSLADDDKMQAMIAKVGRWLLRGPLSPNEIFAFRGVTTTVASAGGEFDEAVTFMLEAMLQSPRFIYRIENQRPGADSWVIDDHELAVRMSYLAWGGPPDEKLAKLADAGDLSKAQNLSAEVQRMLDDPRAKDQALRFAEDWLNLNRLRNLQPDRKKFPDWDAVLAEDMRAETLAFFEDVVWTQKRPLGELFNAQLSFLTPRLAAHYRLPDAVRPKSGANDKLQRVALESVNGRGGLLTHGSVLTIGGDDASMVTRGLFVFHDLLRGVVKNPPAGLDVSPVPTRPGLSHRTVAEQRITNKSCGGCHEKFEPLAFGLEKFDGLGAWFDVDQHGNPLREDGEVRIPGDAEAVAYQSVGELMDVLATSERVAESLTWKLVQFGLGRRLTAEDAPLVSKVHKAAVADDGGSYRALIKALVMSDLVRKNYADETDG